jgi:hypothetical protein
VPADLITVGGLGNDFPGYVKDVDAAGNFNPVQAAMNRSVILQLDC